VGGSIGDDNPTVVDMQAHEKLRMFDEFLEHTSLFGAQVGEVG
jgi:hypothetical protein